MAPRSGRWVATLLDVGVLPLPADRLAPPGVLPAVTFAMPVRALLLRDERRAVLVDAGPGELVRHWPARGRDLLGPALADAGVGRSDVDLVLLTHLDFDHVGGTFGGVDGRPQRAFPRAEIRALDDGIRFARDAEPTTPLDLGPAAVAALDRLGVLDALVDGDEPVPGVRIRGLPGHRPGHAGYEIETCGGPLVHVGDLFHHELHVTHPEWHDALDSDPETARRTRAALTEEVARRGVPCVGGHLPGPEPGRIVAIGPGFRWQAPGPVGPSAAAPSR